MRNLKKILALVLALVMSLSLMATAGAADFSDADQISDKYSDAVTVLNGLEVFKGYDNGARFEPQGDITRAEVAAIIYRIATGDVSDTQKDIYSTWGLFTDVADGSWYAGYVNYCANAGYIKGRGNKIFDPNGKVTGYEALAMILRAIGYDKNNEFSGTNWQVNTASIAKQRGITNNITDTLLGQAATREVVAEILFQAILVPTVTFNTATLSYTNNATSLGEDVLKLNKVTGVVVANEYANLNGTSVLAEGKTSFEVDGKARTLDYSTDLTDIGMSMSAYLQNAKVLSIADSGKNNVFDNTDIDGDRVEIDTKAKFKKATDGIEQQDSTEFYTNFGFSGLYDSDYRIDFEVLFASQNDKDAFNKYKTIDIDKIAAAKSYNTIPTTANANYPLGGYRMVYNAGDKFDADDLKVIESIFGVGGNRYGTANIDGRVWVNSSLVCDINNLNTVRPADIISYNTFKSNYVSEEEKGNWKIANDGEWVKIIDNDGDMKAEYAFKTTFTLDKVVSTYTKDGTEYNEFYALDLTEKSNPDDTISALYMNDVAVGDIVLHTTIDKQALIWKAETDEDSVKLVSHKDETITTASDTLYKQSRITNVTRLDDEITAVDDSVNYIFYKDAFGRVRAYEPVDGNKYALLTEMYFNGGQNDRYIYNRDLTVEMFAASSSGKEYNVSNASASDFILRLNNGSIANWGNVTDNALSTAMRNTRYNTTSNRWQNNVLQPATSFLSNYAARTQDTIFDNATTNVARYITESNGDVRLLNPEVNTTNNNVNTYSVRYVDLDNSAVSAKQDLYNIKSGIAAADSSTLRALSTTEFYIVSKDGVSYFTDYRNMPKIDQPINAAYAVARSNYRSSDRSDGTINNNGRNYWLADVIVIEAPEYKVAEDDLLLVLGLQTWWNNDVQSANSRLANTNQNLLAISSKTGEVVRVIPNNRSWGFAFTNPGLYRVWGLEDVEDGVVSADRIEYVDLQQGTSNVADTYKLRAGTVESVYGTSEGSTRYLSVWTENENTTTGKATTKLDTVYANAYNWAVLERLTNRQNIDTVQLRFGEIGDRRIQKGDNIIWIEGSNSASKFIVDLDYSNEDVAKGFRQTPTWLDTMWSYVVREQTEYVSSTSIKVMAVDANGEYIENVPVMLFDEKGVPMNSNLSSDKYTRSFIIPSGGDKDRYLVSIVGGDTYQLNTDTADDVLYRNTNKAVAQYSNGAYSVDLSEGTVVVRLIADTKTAAFTGVYRTGDTKAGPIDNSAIGTALGSTVNGWLTVTTTDANGFYDATDETIGSARVWTGEEWVSVPASRITTPDNKTINLDFSGTGNSFVVTGTMYVVYTVTEAMTTIAITVPTTTGIAPVATTQSRSNERLANPRPVINVSIKDADGTVVPTITYSADGKFATYTFAVKKTATLEVTFAVVPNTVPAGRNVKITFNNVERVINEANPWVIPSQKPADVKAAGEATATTPMAETTTEPVTVDAVALGLKSITVNGKTTGVPTGTNGTYSITNDVYVNGADVTVTVLATANDSTQLVSVTTGADADNFVANMASKSGITVAANGETAVTIKVKASETSETVYTYTVTLTNKPKATTPNAGANA